MFTDEELDEIILNIMSGVSRPMTEDELQEYVDKAREYRTAGSLIELALKGKVYITGLKDGELSFRKK